MLEGTGYVGSWPGLDPATDTDGAANQSYMDSIFGELFGLNSAGKIVPDLATGYSFSNGGKTINITLRQGVTFSDGTAVQRRRGRVQLEAGSRERPAPASRSSSPRR